VHVPGCPPRPEALAHGILRLREKVQSNEKAGWRERYDAVGTEEILSPTGRHPDDVQTDLDTADISVFKHGDTAGA
ncbi:MAG TPA: hypothetical protein VG321_04020, partial [Solirubrobacteraceae bacterium]|nr:hypothetical protein [Solirubrobacteraceae bacterium]